MLKWTISNRREASCETTSQRHPTPSGCIISQRRSIGAVRERRHRRRSTPRRSSLCVRSNRSDKENQCSTPSGAKFTDTPYSGDIKALRDVSNITPKTGSANNRTENIPTSNSSPQNTLIRRRKKQCLNPIHPGNPTETDDIKRILPNEDDIRNHICGGLEILSNIESKIGSERTGTKNTFASTLPSFPYSPYPSRNPRNFTSKPSYPYQSLTALPHINSILQSSCSPSKKPKIDHVNDFLHQISFITSPEDIRVRNTKLGDHENAEVNVSPLLKKISDLRFSKSYEKLSHDDSTLDESVSFNDMSLDKIVDAILDTTVSPDRFVQRKKRTTNNDDSDKLRNSGNLKRAAVSSERISSVRENGPNDSKEIIQLEERITDTDNIEKLTTSINLERETINKFVALEAITTEEPQNDSRGFDRFVQITTETGNSEKSIDCGNLGSEIEKTAPTSVKIKCSEQDNIINDRLNSDERENELNQFSEENLVNNEQEIQTYLLAGYNSDIISDVDKSQLLNTSEDTNKRKRTLSCTDINEKSKDLISESSFTLKRQKCIRRRKTSNPINNNVLSEENYDGIKETPTSALKEINMNEIDESPSYNNDNSFSSSCMSGKLCTADKNNLEHSSSVSQQLDSLVYSSWEKDMCCRLGTRFSETTSDTLTDRKRTLRRSLSSPITMAASSTPTRSRESSASGFIDLSIQYRNGKLTLHGKLHDI